MPVHPLRSSQCAFASGPVCPLIELLGWDADYSLWGWERFCFSHLPPPGSYALLKSGGWLILKWVFPENETTWSQKRGCWLPADVNERKFHEYLYHFGWRAPVISWLSLFSFLISWSLATIYHHPPAVGGWDKVCNSGEDSSEQHQVRPERKLIYIFNVLTGEKNVRRHYHGLTIENPSTL